MNDKPTPRTDERKASFALDTIHQLERELTAATEQRDQWKDKYIQQNKDLGHELRDPNGTIWSECKRLQTELDAVTKQRNVAAEALLALRNNESLSIGGAAYGIVEQALQSLTTKEQ
jgi:hypothetical protein